jgi:DNA polymerase-3 subunit gamma/tau
VDATTSPDAEGINTDSSELTEIKLQETAPEKIEPDKDRLDLAGLVPENWINLYYQLKLSGITGNMAANSLLESVEGNELRLLIDETQATLLNEEHQRRIEQALCRYFDEPVVLVVVAQSLGEHPRETPARWRRRQEAERLLRAQKSFENDAAVQEIINRFAGVIVPDSIEPLTPRNY